MSLLILMTGLVSGCLQPVKAAMISVVVIRCFMRLCGFIVSGVRDGHFERMLKCSSAAVLVH